MQQLDTKTHTAKHVNRPAMPHQSDGKDQHQSTKPATEHRTGYKDRFWIPRFWDGMGMQGWFSLLAKNRFAFSPSCLAMAGIISSLSVVNSTLWLVETAIFGRRIKRTKIEQDPIFVIGHWRSGTTLLHELLIRDKRYTYPDTYACFAPTHFLASGWFIRPSLKMLMPSRRPIDNMAAGWDRPQEDEFALCNMGLPSPYLTITFPKHAPQCQEYLNMEGVPAADLERWRQGFMWFIKSLTLRNPKRIVLKSPAHTCRVRTLLEMFPKAKFVHIVRDPFVIFPSTVNLWKRLYQDEGLQMATNEHLDEHVMKTFERMYETFERDRSLLGPGQFCELRYEDLVADPLEQMRLIYERLELGEFEAARPAIEDYFAAQKDYKTNRYQITPERRAEIAARWSDYIQRYGYADKAGDKTQS
jgi:omega-hydroxy-beta-dihydromenaquinone-9 sulfotransferase